MSQNICAARSSAAVARKLGREMMVMSGPDFTLFTLDEVATIIWESLNGLVTLEQTVELKICAELDVETAAALLDAEMKAEALAQHGILHISREPIVDSNAPLRSAR
jgi:hypothetical protein